MARILDLLKDGATKLIGQATKVINNVEDELNEKPPYYTAVKDLETELQSLSDMTNITRDEETKNARLAAVDLIIKLKNARDVFDYVTRDFDNGKGMSKPAYIQALYNLATTCNEAIHTHQPALMAKPDWKNQLIAYINNVAEKYLGMKDLLPVEESKFAKNADFKKQYEQVKQGKENMETSAQEDVSHRAKK